MGTLYRLNQKFANLIPTKSTLANETTTAPTSSVAYCLATSLAYPETTNYATKNYAVGDYVMISRGQLCKATQAISNGSQIIPGTNVTGVRIAGEMSRDAVSLVMTAGSSVVTYNNYCLFSPISKLGQILIYFNVGSSQSYIPYSISYDEITGWYGGGIIIKYTNSNNLLTLGEARRFSINSSGQCQSVVTLTSGDYVMIGNVRC